MPTGIYPRTEKHKKYFFKKGHISWNTGKPFLQRENHPLWKGGKRLNESGYVLIRLPRMRNGYIYEHRLIMEAYIKRKLRKNEIVHHRNGDVSDNRIVNLMLFSSNGKHLKYHWKNALYKKSKAQLIKTTS